MMQLENSTKQIGNLFLHTQARKAETLPNSTQVDFSSELDVLLSEVIRTLR